MRRILETQRVAFLSNGQRPLAQRRADLAKLGTATKAQASRLADAISADFGNRSRYETELAEVVPVLAAVRHTIGHLPGWMRPKRGSHPRPLALYYFGHDTARRDEVLRRTTSGGCSVNAAQFHVLVETLPFGGVGASGIDAYHGEFGFQTFSHRKGVYLQSRLSGTRLMHAPFGRITI
jgi:acyl-CoA reductase-like NAD-dependent aldehyde dehydrogenase